jgi:hypothetical protein
VYVSAPGIAAAKPLITAPAAGLVEDDDLLLAELIAPPAPPMPEWIIRPGLLRGQLEAWSAKAGYQLIWEAKNDFEMSSQANFQDDYIGAVTGLFTAMHDQGNPLRVPVYQGNKVLKVTED